MRYFVLSMILAVAASSCQSGGGLSTVVSSPPKADTAMLQQAYDRYKEPSITHRRFKHADVEKLVLVHKQTGVLEVEEIGRSVLNKSIYELRYGQGPNKVMMWSQMHGNEPTATMALLDLFNFFEGRDDGLDSVRKLILDRNTLYFIPMLNPDGADRYVRRNALDIDLNRDARAGATPEGGLLKQRAEKIKPSYGFNLHDQNIYYNVEGTSTPVTIALLAPAYNYERDINDVRGRAIKLAVGMNRLLQELIPGAVARYDDAYTPRGFGDNFQQWGASTVLIESGGYKGDPEKQYIRELNFKIILNALIEIAQGSYEKHLTHEYDQIPINDPKLFDLLIRGVRIKHNDSLSFVADLGINRDEITQDTTFTLRGRIADVGDLKENYGYDELAEGELDYVPGKVYPRSFTSVAQIDAARAMDLLREGYCAVRVNHIPAGSEQHGLPLVIFNQRTPQLDLPAMGREAHFFLAKDGKLLYAVVNGQLVPLQFPEGPEE